MSKEQNTIEFKQKLIEFIRKLNSDSILCREVAEKIEINMQKRRLLLSSLKNRLEKKNE